MVLKTAGNSAQGDPREGREAPLYRVAFEKHGGCIAT